MRSGEAEGAQPRARGVSSVSVSGLSRDLGDTEGDAFLDHPEARAGELSLRLRGVGLCQSSHPLPCAGRSKISQP